MKEPISIGDLITLLKHVEDTEVPVEFDFPENPTFDKVESWRGVYAMPALSYHKAWPPKEDNKVSDLIKNLEESISGKVFQGYKGGDNTYTANDFLHVANYGDVGDTVIVGIKDLGFRIILLTEYQPERY